MHTHICIACVCDLCRHMTEVAVRALYAIQKRGTRRRKVAQSARRFCSQMRRSAAMRARRILLPLARGGSRHATEEPRSCIARRLRRSASRHAPTNAALLGHLQAWHRLQRIERHALHGSRPQQAGPLQALQHAVASAAAWVRPQAARQGGHAPCRPSPQPDAPCNSACAAPFDRVRLRSAGRTRRRWRRGPRPMCS